LFWLKSEFYLRCKSIIFSSNQNNFFKKIPLVDSTYVDDLNNETVTLLSHIEKAGLFQIGVEMDNIIMCK
jgi:hypothetical protein